MLSEFELIHRFFQRPTVRDPHVVLGIGDDCALLQPSPGMQMAISSDMLVAGRHFFADADPTSLGHKALAVNLSDLAAMGARPLSFTLALALPEANPVWLQAFADGMFALADAHECRLIGGDTTKGPLNICITVFGEIPPDCALRRSAAKAGDDIWVSGQLGDARLALAHLQGEVRLSDADFAAVAPRLHTPQPRIALGLALRGIAHAALDVSDGLSGDLQHILDSSKLGASLKLAQLPISPVLRAHPLERQYAYALGGGDDYELCFTAPPNKRDAVLEAARLCSTAVSRIGHIQSVSGLRLLDANGKALALTVPSFDHFK
jgi:thiamine-monophosphate kinase